MKTGNNFPKGSRNAKINVVCLRKRHLSVYFNLMTKFDLVFTRLTTYCLIDWGFKSGACLVMTLQRAYFYLISKRFKGFSTQRHLELIQSEPPLFNFTVFTLCTSET